MFTEALENTLLDAIKGDDVEYVKTVIELIHKHHTASLFARDNQNNNFLHLALKHGASNAFKFIYSQIRGNVQADQFISQPDHEGNTLLALAVISNDLECAELVFNHFPLAESLTVFFQKNNLGNTPLHLAACKHNCDLFSFIIDKIRPVDDEKAIINSSSFFSKTTTIKQQIHPIINQANNESNTPLHLATAAAISSWKIAELINLGANFSLKNNDSDTLISLMLKHPIQEPFHHLLLEVFPKLSQEKKLELFAECRSVLIEDINNETLKTFYFLLATNINLLTLTQAHLEFNNKVPLKLKLSLEKLYLDPIPANYRRMVLMEEKEQAINRILSPKMNIDLKRENLFVLFGHIEKLLLEAQTRCQALEDAEETNDRQLSKLGGIFGCIATIVGVIGFLAGLALAMYFWFTDKEYSGFLHFFIGMCIFFGGIIIPPGIVGGIFGLVYCIFQYINDPHVRLGISSSQLSEITTSSLDFPEITTLINELLEQLKAKKVNLEEVTLCLAKLEQTKTGLEHAKGSLYQDKIIVDLDEEELQELKERGEKAYLLDFVPFSLPI